MPYRPKGSRFWHYDFQIGGRRFHGSCGTESHAAAKALEAEARVRAKATGPAKGVFTLNEALGTYYTDVAQFQPSAKTTLSQSKMILTVIEGKTRLPDLTNAEVLRFIARRRATVSNATVNRQLQLLGRALRHMGKFHAATLPDLALVEAALKEPGERKRELSWDEQARLFAHLRADLHPLVKFALMTGARVETITGLQWRDVDLRGQRMTFRLKGGEEMLFPINGELRAFLSALPRDCDHVLTYMHKARGARRPISPGGGGLMADFRAALAAAGIQDFRFHDLRHTFATRMLRQTGNLKLVSRLLGHASIETTARYAHVLQEDLAAALMSYSALDPKAQSRRKSRSHGEAP